MGSMAPHHLPPEILDLVLQQLSKYDLKQLRLVCKACNERILHLLFDEVFITARYSDLEVARLLVDRYGPLVKTLKLSSEHFRLSSPQIYELWKDNWRMAKVHGIDCNGAAILSDWQIDVSKHRWQTDPKPPLWETEQRLQQRKTGWACYEDHVQRHCRTYNRLQSEQEGIGRSGRVLELIHYVLFYAPNISKVLLKHTWRIRNLCWCMQAEVDAQMRSIEPWARTDGNTQDSMKDGDLNPHPKHICVQSKSCFSEASEGVFTQLMMALKMIRRPNICEIIMDVPDKKDGLSIDLFEPMCGLTEPMMTTFSFLKRLELVLDVHPTMCDRNMRQDMITKVLAAATNVEILSLKAHDIDPRDPIINAPINGCNFPKLRSLALSGFGGNASEIIGFLRSSGQRPSLRLDRFTLREGSWSPLIKTLRDTELVRSIELGRRLKGSFDSEKYPGLEFRSHLVFSLRRFFDQEKGSDFPIEPIKYAQSAL